MKSSTQPQASRRQNTGGASGTQAGGKRAVARIALAQLARQREELLREFNDWQAEYQRKMH